MKIIDMKILKCIFSGLIMLLILSTNAFSQNQDELPNELVKAFKQGNSISLSDFFGDRIELSIQDKEAIYSKSQAKQIMAKFFKDYPPVDFKKKHTGGKPGASYVIGDLITKDGNFRVNFLLKNDNQNYFIHQLHIEKN